MTVNLLLPSEAQHGHYLYHNINIKQILSIEKYIVNIVWSHKSFTKFVLKCRIDSPVEHMNVDDSKRFLFC